MTDRAMPPQPPAVAHINPATRAATSVLGVALAVGGTHHGVLEIVLHGNRPTPGFFIQAIGEGQLMWNAGTEGAFTLIPSFLLTGIATILISLLIILWSVFRIHTRHGRTVFLMLFIVLTFVGGGIGHIVFFLTVWAYATRIDKPLRGWRRIMPCLARTILARLWVPVLGLAVTAFIIGLEISVFGMVVGLGEEQDVLRMCWSFLAASLVLINLAYACSAARDVTLQEIGTARPNDSALPPGI